MRVKRLEVQGFKSFKDKTVIHFDHSITGIVGPNGCGKSNIVDAFFWVMGEQSYKHMRGTGSEDLIFNGSSKYSPLGLAEATLVMETDVPDSENSAAGASVADIPLKLKTKEISVTRRVYRTGEGEYLINGLPARLKDIQELFMDTGVGAKGYSVIEQGQIGKIVNAKPEDRRLLIEEAAGIAKYKARKKESLRKMEATHANLSRLNDVIQEIERNLSSLERQAQKARSYKKIKEELLDKELTWGRRKSQVFRQKLDSLKARRDGLEQELVGLRAELQVAENSIESERVDQVTDSKRGEELQLKIQEMSSELSRSKAALDLSRRRQGDLTSQLESLEQEKAELEETLVDEREKVSVLSEAVSVASVAVEEANGRVSEKDAEVRASRASVDSVRRELEASKRELMTGIAEASSLLSRAAALESRSQSAAQSVERLMSQAEALRSRVSSAEEEFERASQEVSSLRTAREELASQKSDLSAQIQQSESALRDQDRQKQDALKKVMQLRSKLQSLEELVAAREGMADGPKAALDWAESQGMKDSIRALSDLFDVDAGFETAVEGWLEGRLEMLVTDQPQAALSALSSLSESKKGRASFFLQNFGASAAASSGAKPEQVLAALKINGFDVVDTLGAHVRVKDSGAGTGLSALVSEVAVVESLAPIAALSRKGAEAVTDLMESLSGWSVVSRDGWVWDRMGSVQAIRGGAGSSAESAAASILGRKRSIAELSDQVHESQVALDALEVSVETERNRIEGLRGELSELNSKIQETDVRISAVDRDAHQADRTLKDVRSQLELSEMEVQQLREEASKAQSEMAESREREQAISSGRQDLEEKIASLEIQFSEKETVLRGFEAEFQDLKIQEASIKERAQSQTREFESASRMLSDREKRLSEVLKVLERASRERMDHSGGDDGLVETIETLIRQLAEAQDELSMVKDRLEQGSAKLNGALAKIKELHSTGDSKTSESNSMSLEIEKLSAELSFLIQNLEEKYGQGCLEKPVTSPIQEEMTDPVVTHEMTAEEEQLLGEEVERLRERIRRLGEVNVMAIEEFEEAQKRHEYLHKEKLDLETSIENLKEAIEHINKTSEERFARAFEAIATRFEKLFPIIFGGGQAKLSLVYPEGSTDILEAGVDILAQPPGKKVVNIGLLSGGEKALTAVSLIFAIFMVKPSPFCVLDEVDAPLDDANIGKFNALLREMSAKSQFIVITHNKKTMELNDTLYGVTMEEPGVSKMVSIEIH
ncbi:MAG: chromosome segregation protein SMC [Bdellovibrionales bacterium]|nr:chromosome segregation protein SMC [Bdellovibrionales bacterium]